ncbi:MAG TPA: hypothetical protein VG206_25155 [Terriglobia bacterium]|nr:hypothetical protein [Terriglobia bacterium]
MIYAERPKLLAELLVLENAALSDLVGFMGGDPQTRKAVVAGVMEHGGFARRDGKWVELVDC